MNRRYSKYSAKYSADPFWMVAKFNSTCSCGKAINKGEKIYYYPKGRVAVCADPCGRKGENDLLADKSMEISGGMSDCMYDY